MQLVEFRKIFNRKENIFNLKKIKNKENKNLNFYLLLYEKSVNFKMICILLNIFRNFVTFI